jgi:HEAT repeat protein
MARMRCGVLAIFVALLLPAMGGGCASVSGELSTAKMAQRAPGKDADVEDRADAVIDLARRTEAGDSGYVARRAEIVQAVRVLLDDKSAFVRQAAVEALAMLEGKAAAAALADRLRDKDTWVRFTSVRWLGVVGGPEQDEPLMAAMKSDTSMDVRWASAEALGKLKARESLYDLYLALADQASVRYHAYLSLREITGKDVGMDPAAWRDLIPRGEPAGGK